MTCKKKHLLSFLLAGLLLPYGIAEASNCSAKVSYSNGPFNNRVIGSENFAIHHSSTQTTLRNHMRKIRNTGSHSIRIKYWEALGNRWATISAGQTKSISGDLKKIECLGRAHPVRTRPVPLLLSCKAGGGMDLKYTAANRKITLRFARASVGTRSASLSRGQCSLNRAFRGSSVSKFCHSNINDITWTLNARSMDVRSNKAPYAKKIKTGGTFSVRIAGVSRGCLTVR